MGSGKTLHAVKRLLQSKKQGRRTIANFHCRTGMWEFGLWDDIIEAGNCQVVIDEAQMWFSARSWNKQTQLELSYFQQGRKEGVDLIWIAQHHGRVDVAINEITAYIWKHRKISRNWCLAVKTTPEDKKSILERRLIRIDPSLHSHYFTEERIGMRDGSGYGFGTGDAYRRGAAGAGPVALDEAKRLAPNLFRVVWPDGRSSWIGSHQDSLLRQAVSSALVAWASAGSPMLAEDLCEPFFRSGGVTQKLDHMGEIIPIPAQLTLLESCLADFSHDARLVVSPFLDKLNVGLPRVGPSSEARAFQRPSAPATGRKPIRIGKGRAA